MIAAGLAVCYQRSKKNGKKRCVFDDAPKSITGDAKKGGKENSKAGCISGVSLY